MVEAKSKLRGGNGTPHPKGRGRLIKVAQEDSRSNQRQHSAQHDPSKSSLHNLLHVHTQVTQTLHQIDRMVLSIHTLASSNHLIPIEVQDFADALASIDANLQDWNDFLKTAAVRPSRSSVEHEPCNATTRESTSVREAKCTGLSPLVSGLEAGTISCSPLVPPDLLDCDSPCSSERLEGTTTPDWSGDVTSLSPFPQTPRMLSPPRSIRIFSAISESPSLSSSNPLDLSTPEGPTCQNQLLFKTPPLQVTHHEHLFNDGRFLMAQTPGFGVSPPRTCKPLRPGEMVFMESDPGPSTPAMPSPFRTPGISLECGIVSSESSLADSPTIIDDLTASTVKRLGPKGLEERLWQELAIRKADILQSVKHR